MYGGENYYYFILFSQRKSRTVKLHWFFGLPYVPYSHWYKVNQLVT